jgi:hypothetical protein
MCGSLLLGFYHLLLLLFHLFLLLAALLLALLIPAALPVANVFSLL